MNHSNMAKKIHQEIQALKEISCDISKAKYNSRLVILETFLDTLKHNPLQIVTPEKMSQITRQYDLIMGYHEEKPSVSTRN